LSLEKHVPWRLDKPDLVRI